MSENQTNNNNLASEEPNREHRGSFISATEKQVFFQFTINLFSLSALRETCISPNLFTRHLSVDRMSFKSKFLLLIGGFKKNCCFWDVEFLSEQ